MSVAVAVASAIGADPGSGLDSTRDTLFGWKARLL